MASSQMGSKKLSFWVMLLTYLCMFVSCSSLDHEALLPSESLKVIDMGEHGTRNANSNNYAGSGIVHGRKFARGGLGGSHAAGGNNGEHGNNGGSGTTYGQGGAAVIPIYAGGAASNRHPINTRHSAASRSQNCIGLLTFIFTALACLVHLHSG